jgi:hypothetical protein
MKWDLCELPRTASFSWIKDGSSKKAHPKNSLIPHEERTRFWQDPDMIILKTISPRERKYSEFNSTPATSSITNLSV